MSNGCCGARLLAISYVGDESSPCEFNNHALDHFLNRFFGDVNSSVFMEVSLVNEIVKLFLLFIGGVLLNVSIIGGLIWLAIYLFHHYFGG